MQVRHPKTLQSVSVHRPCNWKRIAIASIFVALYGICLQFSVSTIGEPREWALNEQKRIVRKKAQDAKEKGIVVGDDAGSALKKKKAELSIDEDELPSPYLPNAWACLCIFLTVVLHVLFHLLCHWSLQFKVKFTYDAYDRIDSTSKMLILPHKQKGHPELQPVQEPNSANNYTFEFQHIRYEILDDYVEPSGGDENMVTYDEDSEYACRLIQSPTDFNKAWYRKQTGLQSEEAVEKNFDLYGANVFELPYPTFLQIFREQLASPIVIFQLLCAFLWALDTYWKYTMFTLMTILGFEASTAFQRLKSMSQLRGMSAKSFDVWVYRRNRWVSGVGIAELLPGDIISLQPGEAIDLKKKEELEKAKAAGAPSAPKVAQELQVPCDCVILHGSAVVNEASLTGESVPQMKDAVPPVVSDDKLPYDMQQDKVHTLYSGTTLIQATNSKEDGQAGSADEDELHTDRLSPPDQGIVCYVLRTGFSSSQGELMRMIEFSQQNVTADKKETCLQLLFLFCFALCAAAYVLKKGLEDPERPTYKVLLRCVLIITQVVPPSLPMQMAFAVHTALMSLMKAGVYCTEPFRVPEAGKIKYCFFDKTGTITSDSMMPTGIVMPQDQNGKFPSLTSDEYKDKCARPMRNHKNNPCAFVLAGCNALIEVNERLCGDPIEIAALKGIEWSYDSAKKTVTPGQWLLKRRALAEARKILDREPDDAKKKQLTNDVNRLVNALKDEEEKSKHCSVVVHQRFHFASALQRMSTICEVKVNDKSISDRKAILTGSYAFVKGSPEMILKLLKKSNLEKDFEQNYNNIYRSLAELGHRVLALAYRPVADHKKEMSRDEVEKDLFFAGFASYKCETRRDSKLVIQSLNDSAHTSIMVTGDAALTAYSVAKEVDIARRPASKAVVLSDDATAWNPVIHREGQGQTDGSFKCTGGEQLTRLVTEEDRDIVMTGKALLAATERFGHEFWDHIKHVCVFARLSPQQKEEIIHAIGGHHYDSETKGYDNKNQKSRQHTLMCGDGGNDVGALKQADVGVALLSGFGNANVDIKEKKEKQPTGFLEGLFGNEEEEEQGDSSSSTALERLKQEDLDNAEDELQKLRNIEQERSKGVQKKMMDDLKRKQMGMYKKQTEYVAAEMKRREEQGLDCGVMVQMQVMKEVMARLQQELRDERDNLQKMHGSGFATGAQSWIEGLEQSQEEQVAVKLGDASMAAPFTSRTPSICSVVDIIRQGRCTLLSAVQQMQIMMLDSMISAYSLSAMSADGTRPSEQQMMASGTLMAIAAISFNFARPLDRMHPVRPLQSVFHPALFISLLGQMALHLGCMILVANSAKEYMGEEKLKEIMRFEKERNEHINYMDEGEFDDIWWFLKVPFKPNLLNTMVWLVEVSQQVSVMFVNYKGRPWMRGMLENQALFLSLFLALVLVWTCASGLFPQVNEMLKLEVVPEELRGQMMGLLCGSVFGAFLWDRLCHKLFAPEIWAVMSENVRTTTWKDFGPLGKTIGYASVGLFILGTGNIFTLGIGYYYYKNYWNKKPEEQVVGAGAPAAK